MYIRTFKRSKASVVLFDQVETYNSYDNDHRLRHRQPRQDIADWCARTYSYPIKLYSQFKINKKELLTLVSEYKNTPDDQITTNSWVASGIHFKSVDDAVAFKLKWAEILSK